MHKGYKSACPIKLVWLLFRTELIWYAIVLSNVVNKGR